METLVNPTSSDKLAEARSYLRAGKQYQRDRRRHGHKRAELYFDDIQGNWLEEWEDDSDTPTED